MSDEPVPFQIPEFVVREVGATRLELLAAIERIKELEKDAQPDDD